MKKKKFSQHLYEWTLIVISAACNAFGSHVFIYGNKFAPGGVAGIINMFNHFLGDKYAGLLLFLINAPLIIVGFIFLSKDFAIKTTAHILLASVMTSALTALEFPQFIAQSSLTVGGETVIYTDTGKFLMAAAIGGAVFGVCVALMFMAGGSTGGSDIPAAIMQRKNEFISVSWMIFIVNAVIIACSCIVYCIDPETMAFSFSVEEALFPILMAMIHLLCASSISDLLLSGGKAALKFEVVTRNPEELGKELMETLKHGVTLVSAEGMYSRTNSTLLICIIPKREITAFKRILAKYPDTFSYRSQVNEVYGKFRKHKNDEIS